MVATRDIDALVVLPFESEPLTGPVSRIAESGTWVTVVDRGLAQEGIEDLYVAGDNESFGRTAGEYFVETLDEGAQVVVLRGIPTSIDNERVEAFQSALEGSGIEILAMEHGNWNRDDSFTVMQDFLSRYAQIDAVWAADDDMALGAIAAIEQAGRTEEMWVVGGAGMKEMVRRVQDGRPDGARRRDLSAGDDRHRDRADRGGSDAGRPADVGRVHHRLGADHARERRGLLFRGQPLLSAARARPVIPGRSAHPAPRARTGRGAHP